MRNGEHAIEPGVGRRDFIKVAVAGGGALLLPVSPCLRAEEAAANVWVLHGTNKQKLMQECLRIIDANGGLGRNVKSLALKVNAAWSRSPEMGANTHPELVSAFIKGVKEAGVRTIDVPEHPCNRAEQAFTRSGIQDAVKKAGGKMIDMKKKTKYFVDVKLPQGKVLTRAKVTKHFLEADAVVNMPVAKHHQAATLTMAMKNWMGAVEDRRSWHRDGLHECIADINTLIRPAWTIIDATRVMLQRGPQGGSLEFLKRPNPNLLIVSRDQIAADAYATRLFDRKPEDIQYLTMAKQMGLGVTDLQSMKITEIKVSA